MLGILAQSSTQQPSNPLVTFFPLILIGGVFYFLMIRPQRSRARAQAALLDSLEVGDEVMTSGGIFGVIKAIDEDESIVTVEIAPGTVVRMAKRGIAQKFVEDDELEGDEPEEGADQKP